MEDNIPRWLSRWFIFFFQNVSSKLPLKKKMSLLQLKEEAKQSVHFLKTNFLSDKLESIKF